ncbi:hypothetical protein VNO78_24133 [Psophocarpus tetragonolobus]|uniref:Uncharacterized protein n=1 Tax=Psophocarpus tetragonolobus TaxID=3891 RepID=A0AAN9XEI1_PSOTE
MMSIPQNSTPVEGSDQQEEHLSPNIDESNLGNTNDVPMDDVDDGTQEGTDNSLSIVGSRNLDDHDHEDVLHCLSSAYHIFPVYVLGRHDPICEPKLDRPDPIWDIVRQEAKLELVPCYFHNSQHSLLCLCLWSRGLSAAALTWLRCLVPR